MAAANYFNLFPEQLAEKVMNLASDQLKIALTNTAPVATNTVLGDLTEITYTNLSSRNVTTSSSSTSSSTYKLVLTDLVLTSSGGTTGPFRYVVLYNDTPTSSANSGGADPLILWWDYGSSITLADGETLTIDFDATNGVLQLGHA